MTAQRAATRPLIMNSCECWMTQSRKRERGRKCVCVRAREMKLRPTSGCAGNLHVLYYGVQVFVAFRTYPTSS